MPDKNSRFTGSTILKISRRVASNAGEQLVSVPGAAKVANLQMGYTEMCSPFFLLTSPNFLLKIHKKYMSK